MVISADLLRSMMYHDLRVGVKLCRGECGYRPELAAAVRNAMTGLADGSLTAPWVMP